MTAEELKALCKELRCSSSELARALGVEVRDVLAWEAGERFPTKRHVAAMERLRAEGPDRFPRPRRSPRGASNLARLRDPDLWTLVRKLCAHPALFEQTRRLAEAYEDPPVE